MARTTSSSAGSMPHRQGCSAREWTCISNPSSRRRNSTHSAAGGHCCEIISVQASSTAIFISSMASTVSRARASTPAVVRRMTSIMDLSAGTVSEIALSGETWGIFVPST